MTASASRFAHQRLDAYCVAFELFVGVEELALGMPRGYADLKDQVRRAAAATVRHISEGANRAYPRDKAARFIVARGECGECDTALEMAQAVGVGDACELARLRGLADRVGAMLTGLRPVTIASGVGSRRTA